MRGSDIDWRDDSFAVVDVETTGLDPQVNEILSIAIVPVDDGRIRLGGTYYRELRPAVAPGPDTVVIHGIRPVDAAGGEDPARAVGEIRAGLSGRVLVAHVARIEIGFLRRLVPDYRPRLVVDTDALAKYMIRRRGGPRVHGHVGLGAAAAEFGLPEHRRHHALGDAMTTAQLFIAIASSLSAGGRLRTRDLVALGREPRLWQRVARRPPVRVRESTGDGGR